MRITLEPLESGIQICVLSKYKRYVEYGYLTTIEVCQNFS